mmetsp:Transcript_8270/g.18138  ORF Transcript_8270/g.18138 Transcript_8270/m.18138 type:complete len:244 (-) Transcript_8270:87-818(-)
MARARRTPGRMRAPCCRSPSSCARRACATSTCSRSTSRATRWACSSASARSCASFSRWPSRCTTSTGACGASSAYFGGTASEQLRVHRAAASSRATRRSYRLRYVSGTCTRCANRGEAHGSAAPLPSRSHGRSPLRGRFASVPCPREPELRRECVGEEEWPTAVEGCLKRPQRRRTSSLLVSASKEPRRRRPSVAPRSTLHAEHVANCSTIDESRSSPLPPPLAPLPPLPASARAPVGSPPTS